MQVFPDLRAWCENRWLHLVECDLRWVSLGCAVLVLEQHSLSLSSTVSVSAALSQSQQRSLSLSSTVSVTVSVAQSQSQSQQRSLSLSLSSTVSVSAVLLSLSGAVSVSVAQSQSLAVLHDSATWQCTRQLQQIFSSMLMVRIRFVLTSVRSGWVNESVPNLLVPGDCSAMQWSPGNWQDEVQVVAKSLHLVLSGLW